jgi:hypothetical protein
VQQPRSIDGTLFYNNSGSIEVTHTQRFPSWTYCVTARHCTRSALAILSAWLLVNPLLLVALSFAFLFRPPFAEPPYSDPPRFTRLIQPNSNPNLNQCFYTPLLRNFLNTLPASTNRYPGSIFPYMKDQGRDRGLVSNEPYEIEYIHQQFPNKSHQEVASAIEEAKKELRGSESRDKVMELLRQKLR